MSPACLLSHLYTFGGDNHILSVCIGLAIICLTEKLDDLINLVHPSSVYFSISLAGSSVYIGETQQEHCNNVVYPVGKSMSPDCLLSFPPCSHVGVTASCVGICRDRVQYHWSAD